MTQTKPKIIGKLINKMFPIAIIVILGISTLFLSSLLLQSQINYNSLETNFSSQKLISSNTIQNLTLQVNQKSEIINSYLTSKKYIINPKETIIALNKSYTIPKATITTSKTCYSQCISYNTTNPALTHIMSLPANFLGYYLIKGSLNSIQNINTTFMLANESTSKGNLTTILSFYYMKEQILIPIIPSNSSLNITLYNTNTSISSNINLTIQKYLYYQG